MVKKIIVILWWNPYSITINISNNPLPVSIQTGGSMHLRQLIKKGSGQSHAFFFWQTSKVIPLLPPLYILLSGFLPILQLLAEPVFHGVKPASSRSIKLQQRPWYAGVEKPEVQDGPVNDFSGTPCWAAEKKRADCRRQGTLCLQRYLTLYYFSHSKGVGFSL